jgi:hypothetical protein
MEPSAIRLVFAVVELLDAERKAVDRKCGASA